MLAFTKSGIDALGNQATWRNEKDFYDHLTEKEHRPMTTRRQLGGVKNVSLPPGMPLSFLRT